MLKKIKRFLIGRPLSNEALQGEKYGVLWGLPLLSSDVNIMHNNTTRNIEKELLKHKHIVVSIMPLQLKDDDK